MRLDKYLKISRIIKRRTIANEACDAGRVMVNGKVARASYDVKIGDVIDMQLGARGIKAVSYTHLDVYKRQVCAIYAAALCLPVIRFLRIPSAEPIFPQAVTNPCWGL